MYSAVAAFIQTSRLMVPGTSGARPGAPLLAHIEFADHVRQGWSELACSPRVVERSSAVVEKPRGPGRALDAHWLGRLEPLGQSDKELEVLADRGSIDRIGTAAWVALFGDDPTCERSKLASRFCRSQLGRARCEKR